MSIPSLLPLSDNSRSLEVNKSSSLKAKIQKNKEPHLFFTFTNKVSSLIENVTRKKTKTFDEVLASLIQKSHDSKDYAKTSKELSEILEVYWPQLSLPEACKNAKTQKAFEQKIGSILMNKNLSIQEKKDISSRVIKNFCLFLNDAYLKIEQDIYKDSRFQETFDIRATDEIACIKMLGSETHNKGKVPLLIELRSGKTFIYKPRSMIVEQLVCGTDNSLFQQVGLSKFTYAIYDKQSYGYCEFIENRESDNTFKTEEEIKEYLKQYLVLERYARALGLSDLHQENLIVRNGVPIITDAEVIAPANSPVFETGLISGMNAGFLFTSETYNRIWFSPELMQKLAPRDIEKLQKNDFTVMETYTCLSALDVISTIDYKEIPFEEIEREKVNQINELLNTHHMHRIVIMNSIDLKAFIESPPEQAISNFMRSLLDGLACWNFSFEKEQEASIRKMFMEDMLNNDVPVFYYQPSTQTIYYHDRVIAKVL